MKNQNSSTDLNIIQNKKRKKSIRTIVIYGIGDSIRYFIKENVLSVGKQLYLKKNKVIPLQNSDFYSPLKNYHE